MKDRIERQSGLVDGVLRCGLPCRAGAFLLCCGHCQSRGSGLPEGWPQVCMEDWMAPRSELWAWMRSGVFLGAVLCDPPQPSHCSHRTGKNARLWTGKWRPGVTFWNHMLGFKPKIFLIPV